MHLSLISPAANSPAFPSSILFLDMPQKDPCQKQACEIQKCLQANNYVEAKCQAVVQELRKCCARYPKGRSLVCSGFEKEEEENLALKSGSK
ncbi:cx9C motif-containing protein 4 isoform X1 [Meriones unguiculatus]|uniref:cx9C motif-containing protein 4 isoform X1 n=2 Tax=Gerbillinae TaxID=10045 RepID=UPI0024529F11|nr:cx9C motif-containing protein 4 isoform X1 [Psammomys obesus]XP_060231122.1 cx9C motif-containing protein 4 isoform X1 [Meriones unguiculatus]